MKKSAVRHALTWVLTAFCLLSATACSASYRNDLTAAAVLDTAVSAVPTPDGYAAVDSSYVNASMWGADYAALLEAVSDYQIVISTRSDMNIDELGVFHVQDAADVDRVAAIVEDYLEAQTLRYKDLLQSYNPDELPKAENGKMTVCGQYILYTVLDDGATAKAHETFEGALKASGRSSQ